VSQPAPTDRELEALKVLWERGEATVRDLADAMNSRAKRDAGDELAYTTVLSPPPATGRGCG
jgi:predicted transcriptional regulator